MKTAAFALLLLSLQEDFSRWVEQLGSDQIEVRDQAALRLEGLGEAAITRLEEAAGKAPDLEVRARLGQIVRSIRKRAEFSKVFGPTTRATLDAKDQPIAEVLAELGKRLQERIEGSDLDLQKRVSLKLQNATLWEALDGLGRAAAVHADYEGDRSRIVVRPGASPALPVQYLEQFRVGVVEVKRIEHRAPGTKESVSLLVLEVRHQRNMRPSGDVFTKRFTVDDLKDAKGNDVLAQRPDWSGSMTLMGRPFALQDTFMIRANAVGPISVSGTARISFARESKELSIPLVGENREIVEGPFVLKVRGFSQSAAGTTLSLDASSTDGSQVKSRLEEERVTIVDDDGKTYQSTTSGGGGSGDDWHWSLEFPVLRKPQKLTFRWVQDFKTVEIPFRFEGIALP